HEVTAAGRLAMDMTAQPVVDEVGAPVEGGVENDGDNGTGARGLDDQIGVDVAGAAGGDHAVEARVDAEGTVIKVFDAELGDGDARIIESRTQAARPSAPGDRARD